MPGGSASTCSRSTCRGACRRAKSPEGLRRFQAAFGCGLKPFLLLHVAELIALAKFLLQLCLRPAAIDDRVDVTVAPGVIRFSLEHREIGVSDDLLRLRSRH